MGAERCVIMFVRSPEAGTVKSRLAATVGEDAALELYRCFVSDMMEMLTRGGYLLHVFFYPPGARQRVVEWLGEQHMLFPQSGNDLGERMKNAFKKVFSRGVASAILIGSDIPDLPGPIIDEALASLADDDAVVGPSYDGGYYLIGFRADTFLPRAFDGIAWSTPEVFAQTVHTLGEQGRRVHLLPEWRDIDTIEDLRGLFHGNQATPFAGSATMQHMRRNNYLPS